MADPYVGRLAPAPTGALHLGNARTFLIAWLRARKAGGTIIYRLEDLDHPKVKPGAAEEAHRDLEWLGLDWDEEFVQSERMDLYRDALERLHRAALVYPCICTRRDLESYQSAPNAGEDLENRYPGRCRNRFADAAEASREGGREPAWRFRVLDGESFGFMDGFHGWREGVLSDWSGDFPVARGDRPGYQLAVVVDDHLMGVTEVVRGDDLLPSTQRQLALYQALGWSPPTFYHLPLVVGPDGRRLAKRHGDSRLSVVRTQGMGPERVLGWLAWSCGWAENLREWTLAEIWEKCDVTRLPRERVTATPDALRWIGLG